MGFNVPGTDLLNHAPPEQCHVVVYSRRVYNHLLPYKVRILVMKCSEGRVRPLPYREQSCSSGKKSAPRLPLHEVIVFSHN